MSPVQTGFLIGLRPFVELFAGPFWGELAERYKKWKMIMIGSLACWIIFTDCLAFIQPPANSCLIHNGTNIFVAKPYTISGLKFEDMDRRDFGENEIGQDHDEPFDATKNTQQKFYQFKHFPYPAIDIPGISPLPLNHKHIANLEEGDVRDLVSPPLSAVVYKLQDVRSVFLILLILQIIGEFLSTPAITLADTATLGYLDGQTENYGKQRIYGSLGWAVAMFFVGIALDHSNIFSRHPCGTEHLVDRNYMTCYAVFGALMFCALISATQFKFREADSPIQTLQLQQIKSKVLLNDQSTMSNNLLASQQQQSFNPTSNEPKQPMNKPSPLTYIPRGKPGQVGTLPHWITVLKMFAPIQFSSVFFLLWFSGFGVGLVFAFLFWHLQDLGGSPTLFGLASVVNHLSELGAFLFIKKIVAKFGHINVIYAGLLANVVRFLCISYLGNAWLVLPLEFLQGLTHASVWAAGVSYMTQTIPDEYKPTAQLILQSVHLAVGRGCGTVIGGIFISSFGTASVFRGYGVTCLIVGLGYFALNFFFISKLPPIVGAPQVTNEMDTDPYLAPHGVPGSAVTASASSTKLNQQASSNMFGNNISNDYYTGPPYDHNDNVANNTFQQNNIGNYPPTNNPYITEPQQMTQGIYRPAGNQWRQ
ncbi:hypothetical protein HELRODRAFT_100690 [Helobdella robusta]|uniref:Major facilitator superfamily associated domain-containing protein n=1 Tax=Helobdella robusta TaxID=6412 RepID=T1ED13_HELRO|nr:hypothetical protein HELRODRAFT_100690 [Helobdella robusta]ESO01429.1 hypothetical protein HELRODRAFT_100690 [Helobdella robusta]